MTRPTGVTVLAVLAFVGAAIWAIGALTVVVASGIALVVAGPLAALGIVGAGIMLAVTVLWAIAGWGLWTLQPWARSLTLVISWINVLVAFVGLFFTGGLAGELISIVVYGAIIWYLGQREVRSAFLRGTDQLPPTKMAA